MRDHGRVEGAGVGTNRRRMRGIIAGLASVLRENRIISNHDKRGARKIEKSFEKTMQRFQSTLPNERVYDLYFHMQLLLFRSQDEKYCFLNRLILKDISVY